MGELVNHWMESWPRGSGSIGRAVPQAAIVQKGNLLIRKKAGLTCYSSCNGRGGIPAHDVDFAALEGIIVCACAYFLRLIRAQRHVRTVAGLQVCECISCMASSCGETKGIISGDGSVK